MNDQSCDPASFAEKPVPVYNCPLLISRTADGRYHARCATLNIQTQGASEREVLQAAVAQFKLLVAAMLQSGEPICWLDPPRVKRTDESERLIAVHL
jgi:predicted RNase H-like HicB family nuclease